jgi:hypothetical protein
MQSNGGRCCSLWVFLRRCGEVEATLVVTALFRCNVVVVSDTGLIALAMARKLPNDPRARCQRYGRRHFSNYEELSTVAAQLRL